MTDPVPLDGMYILISSDTPILVGNVWTTQTEWFELLRQSANPRQSLSCVQSYEITSGTTQPFEMLTLTISQRRLAQLVPIKNFIDSITPSKTMIEISGYGGGTFIVSSSKVSGSGTDRVCKITAYSLTQWYQSSLMRGGRSDANSPMSIIMDILKTNYGTEKSKLAFSDKDIIRYYSESNNNWGGASMSFADRSNVWRVLQICAFRLGCRIWFEGGKAYIVDFRLVGDSSNPPALGSSVPADYKDMYLHTEQGNDKGLASEVIGTAAVNDDGLNAMINIQTVTDKNGYKYTYPLQSSNGIIESRSINEYGMREGSSMSIPEIVSNGDTAARAIAKSVVDYRSEMQRSITFSVKEIQSGPRPSWRAKFEPASWASSIHNEVDTVIIDNKARSNIVGEEDTEGTTTPIYETRIQLLYLSEVTRHFPQGYSTYTWGKMANTDLAQNFSNIQGR